jgi:hypothetical protein
LLNPTGGAHYVPASDTCLRDGFFWISTGSGALGVSDEEDIEFWNIIEDEKAVGS